MPEQAQVNPPQQMMPQAMQQEQQMMPPQQQEMKPQPIKQGGFIFEMPEQPYFNPDMPKNESWGQTLARVPVGLASTAAKSVGKVADVFQNIQEELSTFGVPEDMATRITEERKQNPRTAFVSEESIEKGISKLFPKKYRDPKNNFIEKGLHRIAGNLPFVAAAIATGGTSTIPMVAAREVGSAIGSQSAESAGFGEFAQALGGLAGSVAGSFGVNSVGKFFSKLKEDELGKAGIQKFGESIKKAMYDESEPIAKAITRNAQPAEEELARAMKKASGSASGLEGATQKTVIEQLKNAEAPIFMGKINLQDAIDQKKHFNKLIKDLPHTENTKRSYYKWAVKALKEVIEPAEREIPSFGKPYRLAEDLTTTIDLANKAANTTKSAMDSSVLKKIPILNYFDKPLWALSNAIPPEFAPYAKRHPKLFSQYIGKIVNSAVNGDIASTKRNLMNFGKLITHTDKKSKKKR